jgi:2-furoyl-CoA dehydrogenase FAD binding subunit
VKPRPFDYLRPASAAEAVEALALHGEEARVLAGGQSLVAMMNFRLIEPAALIDIGGLADLATIRRADGWCEIGAAVTQNRLLNEPNLARDLPLLAAALPFVGHFQTRNRGTVCGSIAHADPSAEIPLALAVLEGEVVLRSIRGTRVLAARDFQQGMLATARAPDEMIVAVRFPIRTRQRAAFREISRRHGDFAIVAVAALAEDGAVRLGAGGVADRPVVRRIAARDDASLTRSIEEFAASIEGYEDIHAGPELRRDLLRGLGIAAAREALRCAA